MAPRPGTGLARPPPTAGKAPHLVPLSTPQLSFRPAPLVLRPQSQVVASGPPRSESQPAGAGPRPPSQGSLRVRGSSLVPAPPVLIPGSSKPRQEGTDQLDRTVERPPASSGRQHLLSRNESDVTVIRHYTSGPPTGPVGVVQPPSSRTIMMTPARLRSGSPIGSEHHTTWIPPHGVRLSSIPRAKKLPQHPPPRPLSTGPISSNRAVSSTSGATMFRTAPTL